MLIRMKFLRNFVNYALTGATPFAAASEEFQLLMLNTVNEDPKHKKLLVPGTFHVGADDKVDAIINEDVQKTTSTIGTLPEDAKT